MDLYKDVLMRENIKKPARLDKLIRALALQRGHHHAFHLR